MANFDGELTLNSNATVSVKGTLTGFYETNAIARFSAGNLAEGPGPSVLVNQTSSTFPNLTQEVPDRVPEVQRDPELGIPYLKFSAEGNPQLGDFYRSLNTYMFPEQLTILIFARLRLDRDPVGSRALHRVGTLLNLGNRDIQVFYDYTAEELDIQARISGGSARFTSDEGVDADWRLYGIGFGAPYDEALIDDAIVQAAQYNEPPNDVGGAFNLTLGEDLDSRGYLDADVYEIVIYSGRASRFELLDLAEKFFLDLDPQLNLTGTATFNPGLPGIDLGGVLTLNAVASFAGTGTVDFMDLEDLLAWYNGEDERFDPDRCSCKVPSWYDYSGNGRIMTMDKHDGCQPCYDDEIYLGGGGLYFPKTGIGTVSCILSGLGCEDYTIFILGRGAQGSGCRRYFFIENAISVSLRKSTTNASFDDLIITINPNHVASRQVIYEAAVERGEFFELLIQGQEAVPDWTIEVSVNRVALVPDEVDANTEAEAIIIEKNCDCAPTVVCGCNCIYPEACEEELTPDNPYSVPYTKSFKMEKDGYITIGEGICPAYAQIAWWNRVLTPAELQVLYDWVDAHYVPAP